MLKKQLSELAGIATSHGCGTKRVLLSNEEAISAITQISITTLLKGETAAMHCHPTMEECFFIRKGMVEVKTDIEVLLLQENDFVRIAPNENHELTAITDCEFMTIGCATN